MQQFKIMLLRLKNPSVVLSIVSQIITILLLLNVKVNTNVISGIAAAICSIFVLLGIMSNPDTNAVKGYTDNLIVCSNCNKKTLHATVNNNLICTECGTENTPSK